MNEISEDLIEAYCRVFYGKGAWDKMNPPTKDYYRREARRGINRYHDAGIDMTLREPTYVVRFTQEQYDMAFFELDGGVWAGEVRKGLIEALKSAEVER